jgi:hypothetical protein
MENLLFSVFNYTVYLIAIRIFSDNSLKLPSN